MISFKRDKNMNGDMLRQITPCGDVVLVMEDSSQAMGICTVLLDAPLPGISNPHMNQSVPRNFMDIIMVATFTLNLGSRVVLYRMNPVDYHPYINNCLANNPIVSSPPSITATGAPPKCECGASKCGGNHSDWCPVK
jgi:hypothetical protein